MFLKKWAWLGFAFCLMSCRTTTPLLLRSVDFMTPHVSEVPFSGYARVGLNETPTQVLTATSAMTPAPATDVNFTNEAIYLTGFFDLGLTLLPHFEIYSIDKGLGAKWQFWPSDGGGFEAAVESGLISVNYNTTNSNVATVSYAVTGAENGLSFGYRFPYVLPYVSYVKKTYTADTSTPNGSVTRRGTHQTKALGIEFLNIGQSRLHFSCLIEATFTDADWDPNYSLRGGSSPNWGVSMGVSW